MILEILIIINAVIIAINAISIIKNKEMKNKTTANVMLLICISLLIIIILLAVM